MSGLLNRKTFRSLPLRSSSIFTEIKGFTSRTTAILTYYNDHRREIEGLFLLPLDHASAIVEFESIIEGHYIFADVKHVSELQEKTIVYESEELHDGIFNVSIGKIPPCILVEIQVTVVCEIGVMFYGDALRYILPQTFSPTVVNNIDEVMDENNLTAFSTLGYSFQIEILIEAPCLLCGVQSNTHPIQVDAPPLSKTGSKLRVSLPEDFEHTSKVFELLMFLCRPREPYILIEEANIEKTEEPDKNPISNLMQNPILMLSYSPDITSFCKELNDNSANQVGEFLLMIDISTSTRPNILSELRESCSLYLKCLPANCFFNLVSFNSTCDHLFPTSQPYSRQNLEKAFKFIKQLKITNDVCSFTAAFNWLYNQECFHSTPRQVFIITNGNINSSNDVMEMVRKKHHMARLFTFCIGSSVNRRTFDAISEITKGKCYIIEEDEKLQKPMMSCLKAAFQPAVTNLKVSWILPEAYDVIYTPENLPCLFLGDRMNLYAILANKETSKEHERNEKPSESLNSVKEFWFEDFELFDEFVEKEQCSSHDLLTEETTETHTPYLNNEAIGTTIESENNSRTHHDNDNEVFLTEEEASQLKSNPAWQKRSSLDRIQTWRVAKYPDNDIDLELGDDPDYGSDTERMYLQQLHGYRRKRRSSNDGMESIGSSNSHSSNMSSSSHFLAFPGYPTRLGSCRSAEARSPHTAKHSDDQPGHAFNFEQVKDRHLSNEKLHSIEMKSSNEQKKDTRGKKKLTQALIDEHVNTHLIEQSNEDIIERLLEDIVTEKRHHSHEWLKIQEEMTQCTWPIFDYDRKNRVDKSDRRDSDQRDSGFGHRSSSEPRTSDLEEEQSVNPKKSGQFSKSSSGYFEQENDPVIGNQVYEIYANQQDEVFDLKNPKTTRHCSSLSIDKEYEHEDLRKTVSDSTKVHHKKKFRPRQMWNAIIDKVRTLTIAVSERSGETSFKVRDDVKIPDNFTTYPENIERKIQHKSEESIQMTEKPIIDNQKAISESSLICQESKKSSIGKKQNKLRQRYIRNRPLIENSRTISTSSMFEIGQSEIGDVDNLHLLPSHALIYLSGQFGQRPFKRIIPFQLVFDESKETSTSDVTVHQLAAKSIIRDLEIQMDQDEMLMLNSGRSYVKNLIADVSKSSHILSKYTAVVTIDDKSSDNEIISLLKYKDTNESMPTKLSHQPFSIVNEERKSLETLNKQDKPSLYEIKSEKANSDSSIWHTKLTLKSPSYEHKHTRSNYEHKSKHTQSNRRLEKSIYMKIVDLMTSDGFWELTYSFAEALTINFSQLRESCPFADPIIKNKNGLYTTGSQYCSLNDVYEHVWATSVAIAWLNTFCAEYQDEWFLIEFKSKQWLQRQKLPKGFTYEDIYLLSQQTLKILKSTSRKGSMIQGLK